MSKIKRLKLEKKTNNLERERKMKEKKDKINQKKKVSER